MRIFKALFWGLLLASCWLADSALADKRVALVIGNSNYTKVKALPNPIRDAGAVAQLLRTAGFDVVEVRENLTGAEMKRVIRDFSDQTRDADVAMVYYAGHGMEIDGTNYLLPIDAALERDIDVEDEAISLDRVLKILEPARRLRLVILDACRDNPFAKTMRRTSQTRAIGRGLARIEPTITDTLVAFAAKAGSTADDGNGLHSPFTAALLKNLATPGLDLRIAFGRIRDDVLANTSHRQEPFVYGSLGGSEVSLVPAPKTASIAPVATTSAPAVAAPAPAPAIDSEAATRRNYELAAQVATKEAWDSFLTIHPTGFYADLARSQRAKIIAQNVRPQTPAPQPAPAAATVQAPQPTPARPLPPGLSPGPRLGSLQSPTQPAPTRVVTDPLETVRELHTELKRLGCYNGEPNHPWGDDSRRALEAFNRHAGTQLEIKFASVNTLDIVRAKPTRVCPLECDRGFRVQGDSCVKITCRSGFVADDSGDCVRQKPRTNTASRPPRGQNDDANPTPRSKATGDNTARVVCGSNGCLPVRPGCKGEVRPSGQSEVAVVNCR